MTVMRRLQTFENLVLLLGVFGLLAGLFLSVFPSAQLKSRLVKSNENLKGIGLAICLYAQDHHERLPPMESEAALRQALTKYLSPDSTTWVMPGTGVPYAVNPMYSGRSYMDIPVPHKAIVAYEPTEFHSGFGRFVLYSDGHTGFVGANVWEQVKRDSCIIAEPSAPPQPRFAKYYALPTMNIGGALLLNGLMLRWFGRSSRASRRRKV
jgi:hypothetical protein